MTHFFQCRLSLVAGVLISLSACMIKTSAPDADVAGNWTGTYVDGKSNAKGTLSATFAETNGSLTGTVTIDGWACSVASQGTVSGTVTGNDVQLNATFGLLTALSLTGNSTGTALTGSYAITSGVCSGDMGSVTLTKE